MLFSSESFDAASQIPCLIDPLLQAFSEVSVRWERQADNGALLVKIVHINFDVRFGLERAFCFAPSAKGYS